VLCEIDFLLTIADGFETLNHCGDKLLEYRYVQV